MFIKGKRLDKKKLSTLLTVLMIMFMMVSSVFTSKLVIAEDEGADTDTNINLPNDDPQEAFLLKEHLNGESYVEIGGSRVLLSEINEENNEFSFYGDEAEFVLLLSVDLAEDDENEYTYTLPEGVVVDAESLKTSDDLQARLEGNVLTVKKVKVDTPVNNNDDDLTTDTDTPLVNDDIDDPQVNDDLPLDDQLSDDDQIDDNDLNDVPALGNSDDNNDTNDDTDLNKEDDTQNNGGTALDLPEYKTYVELSGAVLPETETITVDAFGVFNKAAMMMLRGPLRAPSNSCSASDDPIDRIEISEHLIAKDDANSAGVYAWIKLNGKQFTLNDHEHDLPEFKEEIDKLPESLPDNTKNVEVYLSWRVDPSLLSGVITKDTVFVYTLPEGINWDPEEVELIDLKDPDGKPAGTFKVNGRQIEATYSEAFIKKVNNRCSSFTSYGTIEGSATMSDWDDVGNEPYHFEGIGYFEPQMEEAVARIRTEKSIVKDTVEYLGEGKFLIQYRTDITGTYKIDGALRRLKNVKVVDTYDQNMSLPADAVAQYNLKSGSEDANDRLHNCGPGSGRTFACDIDYIDDGETLTLTYYLYVDINETQEDPKPSSLASATRTFENDVEVTADDPNDPTNKLKDTSFVIDTYSMNNPKKEGKPYEEAPEQAEWVILYNVGKFSKASSGEFPGINLGGMFISDTMGPDQVYVAETFKIETSTDGENWIPLSGVTPAWENKDQDPEGIKEYFSFTLPENVYDFIRVTYRSESTNQNTSVDLTNTATIASDAEGNDEKSTDGTAPQVGPSNIPKIKKDGNEYGPDGNFEWKIEIDIYKEMNRNVRVYDAMEEGLILYPDTIKVERVKVVDGVEKTEKITSWTFNGDTEGHNTNNRNPKPGEDVSNNPPWLQPDIGDKVTWWIELTDENTLLPANGYEYTTDPGSGEPVSTDDYAKYRITYQTNAPLPGKDEEGKPVSKKYLNEAQVRVKSDDPTDPDDRYNTSKKELEKKYIEKESNDSVYKSVTGEEVDTTHGYIGWFVRVYPLETDGYVAIGDNFTYSTDQTSMKLVGDSVHVYVSTNKQKPTSADEIDKKLYTVTDNETSGFVVKINSAPAAGITKDKYIYLFYQTRVNPLVNNKSIRYTNTATLDRNGDPNYPPATASRTRTDVVISKASKRNGPYVTYTLHINKQLLNIDTARNTLTIEDTRGASIEYIEGSMHFYKGSQYNASDSAEKKEEYELTGSPYSVTSNGHTINITIPDETYVVIEYRAYITQQEGELTGEDAINRAVIKGNTGFAVSNSLRGKVQKARAGTSIDTDHPWIKIMKADSRNLRALQGAVFKFIVYDVDPLTGEMTLNEDIEAYEIETDENGTIWFTTDEEKEWMSYHDKVYEVKEIKAPKGYQLDSTPTYVLFPKEEDFSGVDMFTLNGKEIEVIVEEEQFLYRIDLPNKTNPGRKIPKTGVE